MSAAKWIATTPLLIELSLAGCDHVEDVGVLARSGPVNSVFMPGFKIDVDPAPMAVSRFDRCPESERNRFGTSLGEGKAGCIISRPETRTVEVRLANGTQEVWDVEHDEAHPGSFSLGRPSGSPILSWEDHGRKPGSIAG
ncbi:hypothetical protein [Burkholderia multivorans]|uniref:hypothetical protein n=1 Tax=Burkholderia multivorans TaxID=87883 RepID=UPI002018D5D8|nr:hypothetical protein [Burkholderia multivorans]MCA8143573.1 hypothetical protein [Burkholderia multivorans]MCO1368582.1 hypothetical protein [Burkholderia multivorans]MCO1380473.1 hypothetical protein [Burkholderia multivorans]MDN8032131.1 hypothetical protein [Burkholderia multivorans]UQP21420.1 hypothetical protein L0Y98_18315 [Burkholderia multivorans]